MQAEAGSVEDMGKVARVLDNRLADGMPLQLDTTVNYANGKPASPRPRRTADPSPYNTYLHAGLTPGADQQPRRGGDARGAEPDPGDWRYFVVVDPETGDTRFAVTGASTSRTCSCSSSGCGTHPNG